MPAQPARCHIVLIPGFGGFDALGRVEYYAGITCLFQQWKRRHNEMPVVLRYFDNLPTAAVTTRATRLRKYLAKRIARGEILESDRIVLVGHSTGGLDIRQLILDLHDTGNARVYADGDTHVTAALLRRLIDAVVFLSVPHWGTNIADWVYARSTLRKAVINQLQAGFAGSQVYPLGRVEAGVAGGAASLTGADLLLALRDVLTEADDHLFESDATRVAGAQELASELQLYFRQMATDFHVINDLSCQRHGAVVSPAQFSAGERAAELDLWKRPAIRVLSYATVGGRPFRFDSPSGSPVPALELVKPWNNLELVLASGHSAGTDLSYRLCYRACAGGPLRRPVGAGTVKRVLGPRPPLPLELWDNDGIVNTISMLWPAGETVLVMADHLDIVGHYRLEPACGPAEDGMERPRTYRSYDTLKSAPLFAEKTFKQVWNEIFSFASEPESFEQQKRSRAKAAVSGW